MKMILETTRFGAIRIVTHVRINAVSIGDFCWIECKRFVLYVRLK